jgi:hypothetical protein
VHQILGTIIASHTVHLCTTCTRRCTCWRYRIAALRMALHQLALKAKSDGAKSKEVRYKRNGWREQVSRLRKEADNLILICLPLPAGSSARFALPLALASHIDFQVSACSEMPKRRRRRRSEAATSIRRVFLVRPNDRFRKGISQRPRRSGAHWQC